MKIAVLFGGNSNESNVSIISAKSIINNLDKNKYKITPIYLDKDNNFYKGKKKINNPFKYLKNYNLIYIMIHGKNGEDGCLSSILDFLNIPYVGNKMMPCVITMDKILTKQVLEYNNIKTSPYIYITKYNNEYLYLDKTIKYDDIKNIILKKFKLPLFVKPSNSGSSIGVSKVHNINELNEALINAFEIDERILIEEEIKGKELEIGILEKDSKLLTSIVGEVKPNKEFYDYNDKYNSSKENTIIPANISNKDVKRIKDKAKKIFKILNLHGYSRIDFFLKNNKDIILNEVNTIPGFTNISMYPKLFNKSGIPTNELLDILINEAINK